jgi:superfamily II DNA or RNA helicase
MRGRVDGGIWLPRAEVPPKLLEQLITETSVPNPAFEKRRRLGLYLGAEPASLQFIEELPDQIRLPRGAIGLLRRLHAGELSFDDRRVLPAERLELAGEPVLRDYQQAAVDALVTASQGVWVLPTGSGKTKTSLGAIARLRTPTLILVGARDLAEQWRAQVRETLGVEPGLIAGGSKSVLPVTIGMAQSLARMPVGERGAVFERFGFVIVDEAHHVPSALFRDIVDRCPAKYRLGLTATPEREDGLSPLLELFLGQVLATVTLEELFRAGVLIRPAVRRVETSFDYPYEGGADYAPMLDALVADPGRNQLVVDAVTVEARAGHTCLVLSGRKDHCQVLADALNAAGVRAAALTSKVGKAERARLLDEARAGTLPVLVATSLADEGLDLPRLSRVLLAFPAKAKGRTLQRLGRVMRPHPNKGDALVVDFVDKGISVLRRHAAQRATLYRTVLGVDTRRSV